MVQRRVTRHIGPRLGWLVVARVALVSAVALGVLAGPAPVAAAGVKLEARVLLAGNVRLGAWTAVAVQLTNDGPAVIGELRLAGDRQGRSLYGVEVDLPTGSQKSYTLYAQPAIFRTKLDVSLVSGSQTLATTQVPITVNEPYAAVIGVVAERPEAIVPDIIAATGVLRGNDPSVVTLTAADLPPRVEAWGGIDRLIWQDVDAGSLGPEQRDALLSWVAAGGRLVLLGGTAGSSALRGFPSELLPFTPATTIDVPGSDLAAFFGGSGPGGTIPAVTGQLERGNPLVSSAGNVIVADAGYGQGSVTIVGFDPGDPRLAGSAAITGFWRRMMPANTRPVVNALAIPDDTQIVGMLGNIPAVSLPPLGPLLFLLVAYIAIVGPVNYLILRRLDRREWAWITMPAIVLVFAAASYGTGSLLKGTDVIVNEIGIVRAATGTDRGLAQVYVGVFSPSRQTYEVRVGGGALLSNPVSTQQGTTTDQPLDVLIGETSRLRGYEVGYGALRGFRAESPVTVPAIRADLRFVEGRLQGTIENTSDEALEEAGVVFGSAVASLGDLAPHSTREVDLRITGQAFFGLPLSERLYGASFTNSFDPESERARYTRRAVVDTLSGFNSDLGETGRLAVSGPVLLAWRSTPAIDIELAGRPARAIGQTLYIAPLSATVEGPTTFPTGLVRRSVVASDAVEATDQGNAFSLSRGTITAEFRPIDFAGSFEVTQLAVALTQGEPLVGRDPSGAPVSPLPDGQQPPQDDPLGAGLAEPTPQPSDGASPSPAPSDGASSSPLPSLQPPRFDGLPEFQLFDRQAGRWYEFGHLGVNQPVSIADPERYVDEAGAVLVRFVNRGQQEGIYFDFNVALKGTVR